MPEPTTFKIPAWAGGLTKYIGVVVPMLFAGYLAFHDLQQDFALEVKKNEALVARVVSLEQARHAREIRDAALDENLTHIRTTLDTVNKRLERLLTE